MTDQTTSWAPPDLARLDELARQYQLQHSARRTAVGDELARMAREVFAFQERQWQEFRDVARSAYPELFVTAEDADRLVRAAFDPAVDDLWPSGDPPPQPYTRLGVIVSWTICVFLVWLIVMYVAYEDVKP